MFNSLPQLLKTGPASGQIHEAGTTCKAKSIKHDNRCNENTFRILCGTKPLQSKLAFQQIFELQKQPLDNKTLWKPNIKHCKIACRFELDIGPGCNNGKRCRVYHDIVKIRVKLYVKI
jgi:hypothetical protein